MTFVSKDSPLSSALLFLVLGIVVRHSAAQATGDLDLTNVFNLLPRFFISNTQVPNFDDIRNMRVTGLMGQGGSFRGLQGRLVNGAIVFQNRYTQTSNVRATFNAILPGRRGGTFGYTASWGGFSRTGTLSVCPGTFPGTSCQRSDSFFGIETTVAGDGNGNLRRVSGPFRSQVGILENRLRASLRKFRNIFVGFRLPFTAPELTPERGQFERQSTQSTLLQSLVGNLRNDVPLPDERPLSNIRVTGLRGATVSVETPSTNGIFVVLKSSLKWPTLTVSYQASGSSFTSTLNAVELNATLQLCSDSECPCTGSSGPQSTASIQLGNDSVTTMLVSGGASVGTGDNAFKRVLASISNLRATLDVRRDGCLP